VAVCVPVTNFLAYNDTELIAVVKWYFTGCTFYEFVCLKSFYDDKFCTPGACAIKLFLKNLSGAPL
jgi:hypothetical protein